MPGDPWEWLPTHPRLCGETAHWSWVTFHTSQGPSVPVKGPKAFQGWSSRVRLELSAAVRSGKLCFFGLKWCKCAPGCLLTWVLAVFRVLSHSLYHIETFRDAGMAENSKNRGMRPLWRPLDGAVFVLGKKIIVTKKIVFKKSQNNFSWLTPF